MVEAIAKGVWLGLCVAAPVGPIGTLVLKRSLRWGWRAGWASGLGAALADLCYGLLAAAGVRLAAAYARPAAVLGGCMLLWLAWKSWRETPTSDGAAPVRATWPRYAATTFLLTLSNPMTILSFAALIASVGAADPACFVAGVFAGSMLWWTVVAAAATALVAFVEVEGNLLNRVASITLAAFGCWTLWSKALR